MNRMAMVLAASAVLAGVSLGRTQEPPIVELHAPPPRASVFDPVGPRNPRAIRSAEDAAACFAPADAEALARGIDFERQVLLLFAWRGSGRDRLDYRVAESFPEQVFFAYRPGRTRDLREHVRLFALRADVRWTSPRLHGPGDPRRPTDGDRPDESVPAP